MSDHAGVAAGTGRGIRAAVLFLGILPAVGLLAGCGSGGGDGEDTAGDLIVTRVTPTNGQETRSDMSDPEVNGQLTVEFTTTPLRSTMIDPTNPFNGLTANVQILDQTFSRVPGTPSVNKANRTFNFTPDGGVLPSAQYTATISKYVTTADGKQLNNGIEDFSASWTVGPDVYSPVVRNISPAQNQKDTPLYTPIVVTWNESLDPTTVVLGQTVFIQDGGTNPPTQLNGTLSLMRNGFDLVFTPDPCVGMPPATTVVVRLLGAGNTSFIKDRVGNGLVGDPTNSNEVQYQFNTKGIKPLPNPANVHTPGSPTLQIIPFNIFVNTNTTTYAFDTSAVIGEFLTTLRFDPSLTQQVLQNSRQPINVLAPPWSYGPLYGGDWISKVAIAGESVLDWRLDSTTLHTYIYQVDEGNDSIAIINTGTGKVEGHFRGVGTPKGITVTGAGATGLGPTIFVSNYGQGTVTGIPIGLIQVGQPICTAVKELEDNKDLRVYLQAGKNPNGVGSEYWGVPVAGVVNQADNEFQVFDPQSLQPINRLGIGQLSQRYQVGENPVDVAFSPYLPANGWIFAFIVNQGGPTSPEGSVSFWWNTTGLTVFASNSGAVMANIKEGINVPGRPTADPAALTCYIANTGGDEIVRVEVTIVGGQIGTLVTASVANSRIIGPNPTKMTWAGLGGAEVALATLAGTGQVAVWERAGLIGPPILYNLPGAKSCFSCWDH
jgi:hypothetical protein